MLSNVGDIITEVLVRSNRTTTDSFITDQMLFDWTRQAHVWATSFHKWPFTEGRIQSTYATGSGPGGDELFLEGFKSDSLRILQVGGKRLQKLNFEDYQIMREETPDADDKVFSDFNRTIFINPQADLSGTLVAYLQYQPNLDSTDLTATTVFSGYDEEGNEGIVEKMLGYLKRREHLPQEADLHDQRAAVFLENVWKRAEQEQYAYHTHETRGGMWERIDVINGQRWEDTTNPNQFF